MGCCLCWGTYDCLHPGKHLFLNLVLYLRESICLSEFWSSRRSGGSGDPLSTTKQLRKMIAGPPWSPMSRSAPSPWQCQGNALTLFFVNLMFSFYPRFLSLFVIAICKHKSARLNLPLLCPFLGWQIYI